MEALPLPSKIEVVPHDTDRNRATVVIEPCYPGYGTTLGNALRRVLLSSLPGAAVTQVRIKDVQHEFSTLPNVKEDVVDVLLNVKQLRVKIHEGESGTLRLRATGEKVAKAGDIECPSNVEIMNPSLVIATLTDKSAELDIELSVHCGRGYIPVEQQEREKADIGVIAVDAIYTPVRNVNFRTENVRVGQMTNFDKLFLEISTDGSTTPAEAFRYAAEVLLQHFTFFTSADLSGETKQETTAPAEAAASEPPADEASQNTDAAPER